MQQKIASLYVTTGVMAIVLGGLVSAFCAKQPTTFAMWASAYLVLVVGVAQVIFGAVQKQSTGVLRRYWAYGLFNVGNILVIVSTAMKYAQQPGNIVIAVVGSASLVASLILFGWYMADAKQSWHKLAVFAVLLGLGVSVPVGIILALN